LPPFGLALCYPHYPLNVIRGAGPESVERFIGPIVIGALDMRGTVGGLLVDAFS